MTLAIIAIVIGSYMYLEEPFTATPSAALQYAEQTIDQPFTEELAAEIAEKASR